MYKKTITYEDFKGEMRTEEFLFNLTEAEVLEWLSTSGEYTIDQVMDQMSRKRDTKAIIESAKSLIYKSYGEMSLDGRRFIKTPEVKAEFMETNAYSKLFMELATDGKAAAEFINGIIPKELAKRVDKIMAEHPDATPGELRAIAEQQK